MQNVLKIALIIIGFGLTLSGILWLILPEGFWAKNAAIFTGENSQQQAIALSIFGLLVLLAGWGFRKR